METKINSGAIFKNDKKTSDKAPEYKGKINVDGKEWQIALWINQSKSGVTYFSAKLEEPYQKESAPESTSTPTNNLPF